MTVVIPTRNREAMLRQTLHSITHQQGVCLTVIVVDDASTDGTPDFVDSTEGIRLIRHEYPLEQGVARNHGCAAASTPWVAFCDDDDLWAPTKLRKQLDAAEASESDWCTVSAVYVDENLMPVGGSRLGDPHLVTRHILKRNIIPSGSSGVLVRRSLFEKVGGFQRTARFVEDWDLWIRLSMQGEPACVDEFLVAARQWSRSFSHSALEGQYEAVCELVLQNSKRYAVEMTRPRGTAAYEVKQRLGLESRYAIAKDLPRLLRRSPGDAIPILLMLGLPDSALAELRLRKLGKREVMKADDWISPYRQSQLPKPPSDHTSVA